MVQLLNTKILLADMSWAEVQERLKETDLAIVPAGSIEQHGRHLPLKTDTFIASEIARRAAEKVKDEVKLILTPPISFGYSPMQIGFPGSIWLDSATYINTVKRICECLLLHGFKKIVILNGHGGNSDLLFTAISDVYYDHEDPNIFLMLVNWGDLALDVITEVTEAPTGLATHAEEIETSVAMALDVPVDLGLARKGYPKSPMPNYIAYDYFRKTQSQAWMRFAWPRYRDIAQDGSVGDPTKATREKGERIVKTAVDRFAEMLKEIKSAKTWIPWDPATDNG
jgi:creatinine amidohydrolase